MKTLHFAMVIAALAGGQPGLAQGTAFTYQGLLNDGLAPATGVYDLQFTLWSAASSGIQIGGAAAVNDLSVVNGLVTTPLDFGAAAFEGKARWLQIAVRPGTDTGAYTVLKTRIPILPAPYAIHAATAEVATGADSADEVPWSGVSGLPAGFKDNVDNDTLYSAGTGLALTGTTFSLNPAYTDGRYVAKAGDVMTGPLTTPNLTVSETLVADRIHNPVGLFGIDSAGDIEFQIDSGNSTGLTAFFEVFNGAGKHVFYVNELGNARTFGDHRVDGTMTAADFSGDGAGLTTAGLVRTTVIDVNCGSSVDYSTSFKKVADIGTFVKQMAGSTIEVTFNGRTYIESMAGGATGATFELRIDNNATPNGRARSSLRRAEAGDTDGVPTSITGIFTGLTAGSHVVSMWVRGSFGGGTKAMLDPGCWSTDHVVVKELK
ncbi:MAG TPA: hypothetical protein PKM73_04135 [Verrucomicrobiota bacterium]|nr:hypothetical protein [Verrucomicrobiota bacterium]HNU50962.1 hypothetical protein [Verrucomicrobiota bacterium]